MAFPLTNIFMEQYRAAAAEGAIVELKLRMLADRIPTLQKFAHEEKLEDVEKAVALHFGAAISQSDKDKLRICRQLRNKILHSEFRAVRNRIEEHGGSRSIGGVKKIDVAGLSGQQIASLLVGVLDNRAGTFEFVADTRGSDPGEIFGWLLELWNGGDFHMAVSAFKETCDVIDRLLTTEVGVAGAQPGAPVDVSATGPSSQHS